MTKTTMGTTLKAWRETKGLSQIQFAKKLGYSSTQAVSKWERGIAEFPPKYFKKIGKALGVDDKELLKVLTKDARKEVMEALKIKN